MMKTVLLAVCLGLVFAGQSAATNQREPLEDGKIQGVVSSTIKDITLSEPMDDTMFDMKGTLAGEEIEINMSLAQIIAMDEAITGLNITLAKDANGYESHLSKLITTLPQLNHLSYRTRFLYESEINIVSGCTGLASLDLSFMVSDSLVHSQTFPYSLKKLETLCLRDMQWLDCRILEKIASLPNLRALTITNLDHGESLHKCGGHRCLEQLQHLSHLSVTSFDPDWQLTTIYSSWHYDREKEMCRPSMPSLTHFRLSLGEGDVDHQLQYFVPDSPLLEELHLTALDHTANLTEGGYKWLTSIKSLTVLRLDNIAVTDQVLDLTILPNLKRLQVRLHKDYVEQKDALRAAFMEKLPKCDLCFEEEK